MNKKKATDNSILIKIGIVLAMFITASIFVVILLHIEQSRRLKEYNHLIDWNSLSVDETLVNRDASPLEGTITFEAYERLRKQDSYDGLSKIDGILPKDIIANIEEGIKSEYYSDSIKADYNDVIGSIKSMVEQCEYINKLYTAYQTDVGIEDIDYCVEYGEGSKDRCDLYDYFITYSTGDLKQYLLDAHSKWESIVNFIAEKEQLDESYIDLYYQDEICTNLNYLDKVDVEVLVLDKDTYSMGLNTIQHLKDNQYLRVSNYNEKDIKYLDQLNLYRDIDFYDGDMVKLADKTISSLFTTKAVDEGSLQSLGTDLSKEELEKQLSQIVATSSDADEEQEHIELEDYQVLEYSLTGQDENDVYYILYKVKEAKHNIDSIPTKEIMLPLLTLRGKAMMAQQEVSEIIMAEINDIDVTDESELEENVHLHD